jgi:hypothetical protein
MKQAHRTPPILLFAFLRPGGGIESTPPPARRTPHTGIANNTGGGCMAYQAAEVFTPMLDR